MMRSPAIHTMAQDRSVHSVVPILVTVVAVLLVACLLDGDTLHHNFPGLGPPAGQWRRTVVGWELVDHWHQHRQDDTGYRIARLHPLAAAMVIPLVSLAALSLFPPRIRRLVT